jgi:NRPS condensation-like uncharacterized protein
MSGGIYIGLYFPEDFTRAGYFSAFTMTGFGLMNGIFGKKDKITLKFLRKKLDKSIQEIQEKINKSKAGK